MWKYTGKQRPQFALEPGPNQESVWDYPPVLVLTSERLRSTREMVTCLRAPQEYARA